MAEWVLAVERAYIAAATRPSEWALAKSRALAAIGAVASRYLAVGTPRSLATIVGRATDSGLADLSIEAHATWFAPREERRVVLDTASHDELARALASDIVCIHTPLSIAAHQLRRGTHVNALAAVTLDDDLRALATIVDEHPGLGALAAGLIDGRQLDEITIFRAGTGACGIAALVVQSA